MGRTAALNLRLLIALAMALVMAAATPARGGLRVTVQPGDTLSAIADRHGVSTEGLARANGIANVHVLVSGRVLFVPTGSSGSGATRSSGSAGGHTVQPGETLSSIAQRYGSSVGAIAHANGLSNAHMLIAGTTLRIPGAGSVRSTATWVGGGVYTVRSGDTLGSIAARFGTSAAALAARNGVANPNLVVVGTRLRISGASSVSNSSSSGSSSSGGYVVQDGDTLGAIAGRFGVSASSLAQANGIANPNVIVVGTRLRIPGGGGSAAPSQGPLTPITAASAGWGSQPSRSTVASIMSSAAARHGVDVSLVRAIGWQESGWWQGARSSTGAIGVMQLMPTTAEWLGPALLGRRINPYDVSDNIEGGTAYIAYLSRQTGSRRLAIASYYQGLGSVSTRGLLAETESYVASVASFIGRV